MTTDKKSTERAALAQEAQAYERHVSELSPEARAFYARHEVRMGRIPHPALLHTDSQSVPAQPPTEFEQHGELDPEGWTPNVFPDKQYFMKCCDCGLVHEMEFVVVRTEQTEGGFYSDELPWPENRVRFKVRRTAPPAAEQDVPRALTEDVVIAATNLLEDLDSRAKDDEPSYGLRFSMEKLRTAILTAAGAK